MNIKQIYSEFELDNFSEEYIQHVRERKSILSKSDKKFLISELLNNRYPPKNKLLDIIIIYAIWLPDEAINVAREKGIFRYKVYGFKKNIALELLINLRNYDSILHFNTDTLDFIDTKISCEWMYGYYKKHEYKIKETIQFHHKNRIRFKKNGAYYQSALFKELLVFLDLTFSLDINFDRRNYIQRDIFESYSKEEISSAISYLIYLYESTISNDSRTNYTVDTHYVKSEEIQGLILSACKIIELQEWEICIDFFNYSITVSGNKWLFYDKTEIFEKSVRMGYIRTEQQNFAFHNTHEQNKGKFVQISQLATLIIENLKGQILEEINDGKLSRFRFLFPEPLFDLFHKSGWFYEEIEAINYMAKEMSISFEDLLKKKITDNCNVEDVVYFQRLFLLMNLITSPLLYDKKKRRKDYNKIINSLIPVMDIKMLENLLDKFIKNEVKTKELIDLLSFKDGNMLDLQYTPIIQKNNHVFIQTTIISSSNIIRNIIVASRHLKNQNVNEDNGLEPLVKICKDIFEECSEPYQVFANQSFTYEKQKGEIDILVINDTDIILIECKSPMIPCNNFELRGTYEHILKANNQLSLSKKAFSDKSFMNRYLRSLKNIEIKERNIQTCIIMGNRLFCGYNKLEHPVRYIYELDMVLNDGTIKSEIGEWKVWKNEDYSHEDLLCFISDEKSYSNLGYKAMTTIEKVMSCDEKKLAFKTYVFNVFETSKLYDENLEVLEANEDLKQSLQEYVDTCKLKNLTIY